MLCSAFMAYITEVHLALKQIGTQNNGEGFVVLKKVGILHRA